jgi:hypothetical protein
MEMIIIGLGGLGSHKEVRIDDVGSAVEAYLKSM